MKYDKLIYTLLNTSIPESDKEDVSTTCPSCSRDNKFYFNRRNGLGYCFVCGYKVNAIRLIQDILDVPELEAFKRNKKLIQGNTGASTATEEGLFYDKFMSKLVGGIQNVVDSHHEPKEIKLPGTCVPIAKTRGEKYLDKRGFHILKDKNVYDKYNLKYCTSAIEEDKKWKYHIIFPHYVNNKLCYFTSRAAFEPSDKYQRKSYHPAIKKSSFCFGDWNVEGDSVVVVEGPLDMLSIPFKSIAMLGKRLSNPQLAEVSKYKEITVCLDSEESVEYSVSIAKELIGYGTKVYISSAKPYGDPADAIKAGIKNVHELVMDNRIEANRNGLIRFSIR